MPKDANISVMEQLCQFLQPLSTFTDARASETKVTVLGPHHHILVEKDQEPSLTKEMKRVMREDLNNRYKEKAKRGMHMACLIEPRFKMSFSDEPEAAQVDSGVQALRLAPAEVREEPQNTSSSTTTNTPTAASEGKGLAGLLRKMTSTRQQRGEEGQILTTPEEE